ncbi:hypothetical protein [Serinicoccus hydrothermalis]|uniref:hypothetical protein n=1 Tax=Serinicoccus hydrothermalis TaxID=1758689 RepID=UPI00083001BF|nr:hypothetical protein [Serinicoccus hydrothermalis]
MTGWSAALVPLLSAVLGAVVGGLVVHRLSVQRDVLGARRSQRIEYLVSAYRRLSDAANRLPGLSDERIAGLEGALADIVLLGEPAEIEAARQFMLAMAQGQGGAGLDPVLVALRASLRAEIGLTQHPLPKPYNLRMG